MPVLAAPATAALDAARQLVRTTVSALQTQIAAGLAQGESREALTARVKNFYNAARE